MANTRHRNRNGLIDTVRSTITQLSGKRGRNARGDGVANRATGVLGGLLGGGASDRARSGGGRRRRRR